MSQTIESFVAKLQAEGVEAGQQAADKLCSEAKHQGEQIIKDARKQADKIIADAQSSAESLLARSQSELELAARDIVLRLRTALRRALEAILTAKVKDKLQDSDFLSRTLHDLVLLYASADVGREETMKINVSPEVQGQLAEWALKELARHAEQAGMGIDLKGSLETAGFEYTVSGATVEVTTESVVELLGELISLRMKEVIDKAVGDLRSDKTPEKIPASSGESK